MDVQSNFDWLSFMTPACSKHLQNEASHSPSLKEQPYSGLYLTILISWPQVIGRGHLPTALQWSNILLSSGVKRWVPTTEHFLMKLTCKAQSIKQTAIKAEARMISSRRMGLSPFHTHLQTHTSHSINIQYISTYSPQGHKEPDITEAT